MAFSGLDENGNTNSTVEIYTEGTGWSQAYSAGWTPPLYPWMHVLPSGKVFNSGPNATSHMFDPSTHTWTTMATTNYGSTRTYGSSVLLPLTPANNYRPKVMILGGSNPSTASTELIDLGASSPSWTNGPSMSQPRIEMNAVILPNGKVLAVGGSLNDEDTTTASLNADLYDPTSNSFSSAGANVYPRLYHSVALLLPDATVALAGGNPQRGTYEQHIEIYSPAYLFNSDGSTATRPTISSAPSTISWGNSFIVQTPDAANISSVVLVRNSAVTHAFNMDQRLVGLAFTAGTGALTVTAPPNSNIAPPGYYMLFLLNSSGVPSLASMVEVQAASAAPDFSISATPGSQTVSQGAGTNYTVSVAPSNGFNASVVLSVSGLPQGATPTFNPTSITGSGSSTLTIGTATTTPAGSYPLTITGTSGGLTHTTSVTLVVQSPDFAISATPASQSVTQGNGTNYSVSITPSGGFSGSVGLSVSGLPQGATAGFNPASITGSGSSTLTVNTAATTPAGTSTLIITGTSGSLIHSTTVTLVVKGPPPTITSISPTSGTKFGGTAVSITGTNFLPGAKVSFGATTATNVNETSSTSIQVVTPKHAPGTVNVVLTNPDGQSATLANGYTYLNK